MYSTNKKEILLEIQRMLQRQSFFQNFVIYYSGHGDEKTGNWITGYAITDRISLRDILNVWDMKIKDVDDKRTIKRFLIIIADSCYSGKLNLVNFENHIVESWCLNLL